MTPRARVIPNTEPKPWSDKPALAFLFLTLIFSFMGIVLLVHWTIKEHVRLGKLDKAAAMTKSAAETFVVGEDSDTEAGSSGNRDPPIGQLDANATSGEHAAEIERGAVREADSSKKAKSWFHNLIRKMNDKKGNHDGDLEAGGAIDEGAGEEEIEMQGNST